MSVTSGASRESQRWNAVLDAALRVFENKGYERASVGDVAAEAGLAKPTLYHYMRSKEELLEAILRRSHERLTAWLADLPPRDSALEMVWQIVRTHVLFNIQYRDETTVLLSDFRMLGEERRTAISQLLEEYDQRLQAFVVEAQRRGEANSEVDSRLAVLYMLGGANFVARWYRPRPNSDPERIATAFADLAISGLTGVSGAFTAAPLPDC